MISAVAGWLVRNHLYKPANLLLNSASFLAGKGCNIRYQKKGYWMHRHNDWVINESVPNFRLDSRALEKDINEIYFFHYQPKNGDTCIDIGAGTGTETIAMSRKAGASGKVYAVEASPKTYNLLQANITDNDLKNVSAFNLAISDKNGTERISTVADHHIVNTLFSNEGVSVKAVTMDTFLAENNIETIDYLKVNIEGAEKLMIRQFASVHKVHHIAVSCHDFLGKRHNNATFFTKKDVSDFLIQHHFRLYFQNTGIDYIDDWIYGIAGDKLD